MLRKLISAGLLFNALLLGLPTASAACTPITAEEAIPPLIYKNQCFELQGGNIITNSIAVHGKLFVRAGRTVVLKPNAMIMLNDGADLTVRGDLEMEPNSSLIINHLSALNISGKLWLKKGSSITSHGSTFFKNLGHIQIENNCYLSFSDNSSLYNSGIVNLLAASFHLHENSQLLNAGEMVLGHGSLFHLHDKSHFINSHRFTQKFGSTIELAQNSRMTCRKKVDISGSLVFLNQSIFDNGANLKISETANLNFYADTQAINHHKIDTYGSIVMHHKSRFLNEGSLTLQPQSKIAIENQAVLMNNGTLRNHGGSFTIESDDNFENENIVAGQNSRDAPKIQNN